MRHSLALSRALALSATLNLAVTLAATFAVTSGGCTELGAEQPSAPTPLGTLAAGTQVITAAPERAELVAVSVYTGQVEAIQRFALSGPASLLATLPDETAALVISRDTETLDRVGLPAGDLVTYDLGAPFEALVISPDSTAAIAYFPPDSTTAVFHNTNEIALVDLRPDTPPQDAVLRRTLASLGGAPRSVHASPLVHGRRYAFVLSDDHVAVLDWSDASAPERSVPLVSLSRDDARTPRSVRFAIDRSGDREALWATITTDEGRSVYTLKIVDTPPNAAGAPAFDVRLTQLSGMSPGGDLALVELPDGRLVSVMVSPGQGTATVTQLSNGRSERAELELGVDRLATYVEAGRPHALVYRRGARAFYILDLTALSDGQVHASRRRYAAGPIEDLLPIPGTPLFVALHDSAEEAVSVIDADSDRITTFGRTGRVQDLLIDQAVGRMFLLTRLGDEDFLVSVQLDNLHPRSSPVPGGGERLLWLPAAETIATTSELAGGQLVLWPFDLTTQHAAFAVPGYLLDGLLDRADP